MSRQNVVANNWTYLESLDDLAPEAEQSWAIATGRVMDEITGQAPKSTIHLSVQESRIQTRVASDGAICLIARPWLRFPPLEKEAYTVHLTVEADGYLPITREVVIPSNWRQLTSDALANTDTLELNAVSGLFVGQVLWIGPSGKVAERRQVAQVDPVASKVTLAGDLVNNHFKAPALPTLPAFVVPDAFTPVQLGDLPLRRRPIVIRGRAVVRQSGGTSPVPNATIKVSGIWRTLAEVQHDPLTPALGANLISVRPGLYAPHAPVTSFVDLDPPVLARGENKLLSRSIEAQANSAILSDVINLAPSNVLGIEPDDVARAEFLPVLSTSASPPTATFSWPSLYEHQAGRRAVKVTPGAARVHVLPVPPGVASMVDASERGDQTLFLDDLNRVSGEHGQVAIDVTARVEYQLFNKYVATCDAEGYFSLPPIHRVAQIQIEASAASHTPITDLEFQPDYTAPGNWLDVVFES